jgi:hypothetical protein
MKSFINITRSCILLVFVVGMFACKNKSDLERALEEAGNNRPELEKVLQHYRNDSLKLRATVFLIENMPGHYSYADTAYMNSYYAAIDSVALLYKNKEENRNDSLFLQTVNRFSNLNPDLVDDIHIIDAGYLIEHIDRAFYLWQEGEWAQQLSFDEFCEYLLPYKICETQSLDNWMEYMSVYGDTAALNRFRYCQLYKNAAYMACRKMNGSLRDSVKMRLIHESANYIPVRKISALLKITSGECEDYNLMAVALMRAHGIPVIMDFTPQWPFRNLGHSWLILTETSGKRVIFEGIGLDPASPHKEDHPTAKVFRKTYARNKEIETLHRYETFVPTTFNTPFIQDVTEEYQATVDIEIPVEDSRKHRYAYLSVFDNASWTPVHWGKLKNKKFRFEKMGKRAVYLPVFYEKFGIKAFADPVCVLSSGKIHALKADTAVKQHLTLLRKYPPFEPIFNIGHRIIGGKIQTASDSLFTDSLTLHTIREFGILAREIDLSSNTDSARYWRYYPPDGAHCNIAELFFYEKDSIAPIMGKIIGTPGSFRNDGNHAKEAAFDRNALTFFDAPQNNGCWVGLDFGRPVHIEKIIYLPRNDGNCIEIGDEYELFYWGDHQWQSLGRKKSDHIRLDYDNCPANALFLLHNHTKGKEERIFTYENGEQVWW